MIIKKCKKCNKEFKIHDYRKDTAFYCSISCSKKGQKAWNKLGLKNNCEICNKEFDVYPAIQDSKFCSHECYWKSMKGVSFNNSGQFKIGHLNPFKNKKRPDISGDKHFAWKGGITTENHKIRTSLEYKLWIKACMERDNWTCQKYGISGGKLQVHHIHNFADYPLLRTSIENGITLSYKAHREFHKKYGVKNNTLEQLQEYLTLS